MYNNLWFPSSLATDHPPLFEFTDVEEVDTVADGSCEFTTIPFFSRLPVASVPAAAAVPVYVADEPSVPVTPITGAALHSAISLSADRLFFVSYRPAGTLRARWYLVQVDLPMSEIDPRSNNCASHGRY